MTRKLAKVALVAGLVGAPVWAQFAPPPMEVAGADGTGAPQSAPVGPTESEREGVGRPAEGPARFEPTEKISADSAVSFPIDI